jgi:geranyl-CoA carboxylase alpha subunit
MIYAHIDATQWDFKDNSFAAKISAIIAGSDGKVRATMNGGVLSVDVAVGDSVTIGQKLLVIEAMKMEHAQTAAVDGTITAIHVEVGSQVTAHSIVVEVEPTTTTEDSK